VSPFTIVGSLVFIAFGARIAYAPTRDTLVNDRNTGFWLYKSAPSKAEGVKVAARFYRVFGWAFILAGVFSLILQLVSPYWDKILLWF
jgi:hypothetical protein